ncbi:MAG TPA: nuclease, partial [Dehalococcoidia bacterium]|nr:nuclease [Dehalococcoidia bacterium]
ISPDDDCWCPDLDPVNYPDGTDASGLAHVLSDDVTMSPERGLFLPESYRMHPNVCAYISEMFYEGKLVSEPNRAKQKLIHQDFPEGTGLWYYPVEHFGNQNSSIEESECVAQLIRLLLDNGEWVDHESNQHELKLEDILVVSPYNAQVGEIARRIENVRVGTVDKFQGQQAPVVIISYATSTAEEAPRGMDFLYSLNRLNVAASRAKCVVFLVCSPELIRPECSNPKQMRLANGLCRFVELAHPQT